MRDGVTSTIWTDSFVYAEGFDEDKGKYIGLRAATGVNPSISAQSLLVKPDIAQQHFEEERAQGAAATSSTSTTTITGGSSSTEPDTTTGGNTGTPSTGTDNGVGGEPSEGNGLKRFYGNVEIDAMRVNRDAPAIANEVIQHLTALNGAKVKITLEIEADIPDGVPDDVVRTVTENCRTLKFNTQSFEQE